MSDDYTEDNDLSQNPDSGKTLSNTELITQRILEAETRDIQRKLELDKRRSGVHDPRGLVDGDKQIFTSEADKLKKQFPVEAAMITEEDRQKYHASRTQDDAEQFRDKLRARFVKSRERSHDRERER